MKSRLAKKVVRLDLRGIKRPRGLVSRAYAKRFGKVRGNIWLAP